MCGIIGVINIDSCRVLDEERIRSSLAAMRHRGPNALAVQRLGEHGLLGHVRLSIIDRDERSNQPMSLGGRYWIVYNGEIYNYLELRRELEAGGARFLTTGDTEVILHAYSLWGKECVARFNGMWAFAIYDAQTRMLFCSRDRFGEKPFNYAMVDGRFVFASEIKAILALHPELAEPDFNVIANFCRTSVGAQQPRTWFQNVLRLQPGYNLTLRDGRASLERYWRYPNDIDRKISFASAREQYRSLFLDAVALRMRSDVPLGLTLSSGLDSTSIACAMHAVDPKPHHCFTAGFDPKDDPSAGASIYTQGAVCIDETTGARKVAEELGLNLHVVMTSYGGFVSSLARIVAHLESGNSSPAVIPLFQLHEQACKHVTVVLEGQGADELLAGYVSNVIWPVALELTRQGQLVEALRSIRDFSLTYNIGYALTLCLRDISNELHFLSRLQQRISGIDRVYGPALRSYSRIKDFPDLLGEGGASALAKVLRRQHSGGLVNLLHYGDSISMACSLENRLPFTDHRLVEFVWSLPGEFKLKHGVGKRIHREAMRGLVPDRILDDKMKLGFATPIRRQFMAQKNEDEDPAAVLLSRRCLERGLFDEMGLRCLIDEHRASHFDHSPLLFRLLSVELWFREFIDRSMQVGLPDKPQAIIAASGPTAPQAI